MTFSLPTISADYVANWSCVAGLACVNAAPNVIPGKLAIASATRNPENSTSSEFPLPRE
jgi:hypothetical protein